MPENEITPNSVPEWIKELLHQRQALCAELAALRGRDDEEAQNRAAAIGQEYAALPPLPAEYAELADKELAAAQAQFTEGLAEAAKAREFMRAAREKLVRAVDGLTKLGLETQLLNKKKEFDTFARDLRSVSGCDAGLEAQGAKLAEELSARMQSETDRAKTAAEDLVKLAEELTALEAAGDMEAYRKQEKKLSSRRDRDMGALPKGALDPAVAGKLRELFRKLNTGLTQHLQTLDLARWESYTLKLDLLRELEAMQNTPDAEIHLAAKRLREIRERWKELGAVPYEKQPELGPKFYEFTTALQHRIDAHFKEIRAARTIAADAKTKLCEEAESLAESTDYRATSEHLKAMQQEWKALPHAGKDTDQALYERFRAACDKFFQARAAWWNERNAVRTAGAKTKAELCEAAEKLGELPRREAVTKARELRASFQATPRAGKEETELYTRFNGAMDRFFQSLRDETEQAKNRREAILTELGACEDDTRCRALSEEWKNLPSAPRESSGKLEARFRAAQTDADKRIRAARMARQKASAPFFPEAMREAVRCCKAAMAGEPLPEITADLSPFPRLAAAVTDLVAAAGTVPEALSRAVKQNTKEFMKLLDEWEHLSAAPEKDAPKDLAAELAAAIAGNFGGGSVSAVPRVTPQDLQRKLLAIGVLDPAEAETLLNRYKALADKLG